jgi:hypothetical protein
MTEQDIFRGHWLLRYGLNFKGKICFSNKTTISERREHIGFCTEKRRRNVYICCISMDFYAKFPTELCTVQYEHS